MQFGIEYTAPLNVARDVRATNVFAIMAAARETSETY